MTKFKIGIVGFGFVGKAVNYGFNNPKVEKIIVDPKGGHNIEELSKHDIKATFVCVPTPMGNDGSIDSSIIESVLEYLKNNVNGLIVTTIYEFNKKDETPSDDFLVQIKI
jgi:UDP-glucose 6-dehydrogenase